jgi:hypothetical protein
MTRGTKRQCSLIKLDGDLILAGQAGSALLPESASKVSGKVAERDGPEAPEQLD